MPHIAPKPEELGVLTPLEAERSKNTQELTSSGVEVDSHVGSTNRLRQRAVPNQPQPLPPEMGREERPPSTLPRIPPSIFPAPFRATLPSENRSVPKRSLSRAEISRSSRKEDLNEKEDRERLEQIAYEKQKKSERHKQSEEKQKGGREEPGFGLPFSLVPRTAPTLPADVEKSKAEDLKGPGEENLAEGGVVVPKEEEEDDDDDDDQKERLVPGISSTKIVSTEEVGDDLRADPQKPVDWDDRAFSIEAVVDDSEANSGKPINQGERATSIGQYQFPRVVKAYILASCGAVRRLAEFLELCEKPLEPGLRRIRWTCVCGAHLYDDYHEISPGSLDQLQLYLNDEGVRQSVGEASTSASQAAAKSRIRAPMPAKKKQPERSSSNEDTLQTFPLPPPRSDRPVENKSAGKRKAGKPRFWIMPVFHSGRYGRITEQLAVGQNMSDEVLFRMLKTCYLSKTSRLQRFFSLRSVTNISCARFVLSPYGPDSLKTHEWPRKKHCPPWWYYGCPAKKKHDPFVGPNQLLHYWNVSPI